MDNDGEIGAPELENMLLSFGKTEGSYLSDKEIAEIVKCGKKATVNGNIEVKKMIMVLNEVWQAKRNGKFSDHEKWNK